MGEIANQPEAPKESQVPQQPKKGGKAGKIIIALIILLLIGIIAILGYIIYNNLNNKEIIEREKPRVSSSSGYVGNVDPSELQRQADDSRFTTNMNVIWNFPDGNSESLDAFIGNLEMNSRDVYVDVVLADNQDEVIYSSPIIPRGQALSKFKLDKELEAGTYNAVCIYSLIDENENVLSTLSIAVTINILG